MEIGFKEYRSLALLAAFGLMGAGAAKAQAGVTKPYDGKGDSCVIINPFGVPVKVNKTPDTQCEADVAAAMVAANQPLPYKPIENPVITTIVSNGKVKRSTEEGLQGCLDAGKQAALDSKAPTVVTHCASKQHHAATMIASQTCTLSVDGKKYLCEISYPAKPTATPAP